MPSAKLLSRFSGSRDTKYTLTEDSSSDHGGEMEVAEQGLLGAAEVKNVEKAVVTAFR